MELHEHAPIWEKLPTETLTEERERIGQSLAEIISKSETINLIIADRATE